ncbi:protein kinase domain-containing protein [Sphingomonas sp. Tas61C01]|uniref:protein kinase domain-containing protein n=1 Tax=Sphingomonas sp. Tas61C01 TaxID=3458297 RepID=UPI00403E3E95
MSRPKLTRSEWAHVRAVFDQLFDLPDGDRQARLRRMKLPPTVLAGVETMIAASARSGVLDARIAPAPLAAGKAEAPAPLSAGSFVGAFRIERPIGRGGMGELYLAHRSGADFDQRVALKLLRPEAAARFDLFTAERQLLAKLEHPGIARLIDGGIAADGRPYMAIEYVEGQDIDIWCADRGADLATRLQLFLSLCEAVAYAHARLIVHRDIKPSNILVDRDGRPRLLDFGVARLLDEAGTDRAFIQQIATPAFAAPEQFDDGPVTVATDIYALGAVLFELLAGRGPWNATANAPLSLFLRRLFQEEPPLPSRVATGVHVPAERIMGDLDAIVAKAMQRAPDQRYSSVEALAEDVRRHLAFRPVRARAKATGYHLLRFLRRNRAGVAATTTVVAALVAGGAGVAWQARKAADQRSLARAEAERLEGVNQAMLLMFRDTSESAQLGSITVRQMIDDTTRRMAGRSGAGTVAALADLYQIVENKTDAKRLLVTALARGVGRSDRVGSARLKLKLATILVEERQFDRAQHLLDEADAVWRTDPVLFRRERVETVGALAYMRRLQGRRAEGIALLIANMPDAELVYADYDRDLATRYGNLAQHLIEAGRLEEADAVIRRGRATMNRSGHGQSAGALTLLRLRAGIAARRGDDAAAEAMLRKTVADRRALYGRSAALAVDLLHYARVSTRLGKPRQAIAALDEATPMAAELLGADTSPALMCALARVDALIALGRTDAAAAVLADAVRRSQALKAPLVDGAALLSQASLASARGDQDAARRLLDRAVTTFRQVGPASGNFARSVEMLRTRIAAR